MSPVSRRTFLAGSAVTAVVAVSCRTGKGGDAVTGNVDLDTAAHAAGIEKLVADTYTEMSRQVSDGKLGAAIPAAVAAFIATAVRHHQDAFDAWNKVLVAAGRPPVDEPPAALRPIVDLATSRLTDVPAAAALGLRLEDYTAQTYQRAMPTLGPDTVTLAARINVVGQQHQAVLRYLLGLSPVGSGASTASIDVAPADPHESLITG